MLMKISQVFRILCFFCVVTPVSSLAAVVNLSATIDGLQANAGAGTGSAGTGSASMVFDDVSNQFDWNISWSGIINETVAHFHGPASVNQNAGVEVGIDISSNPAIGSAILTAGQATDLLAGLWYINIHTTAFGAGEIRGQVEVSAIPVPAAVWLFSTGLFGLVAVSRRHKAV